MKVRTVNEIAAFARERRRQFGWTQADLASKIGVGREWVIKFEQGKTTVEWGIAVRALRELEIQIELSPAAIGSSPGTDDLNAILSATTQQPRGTP